MQPNINHMYSKKLTNFDKVKHNEPKRLELYKPPKMSAQRMRVSFEAPMTERLHSRNRELS